MANLNEENERVKRRYLQYLKRAKRKDDTSVIKAAEGIRRFEASRRFADFKTFHIDDVLRFRDALEKEISPRTGKPLAQSTIAGILSANQGFILWLADQPGYKSRVKHSDADYFNMDAKGRRISASSGGVQRMVIASRTARG